MEKKPHYVQEISRSIKLKRRGAKERMRRATVGGAVGRMGRLKVNK